MFGALGKYYDASKGALSAKKEINNLMEKKPGWKSSEFWLSILSIALTVFFAVKSFINPQWAVATLTVITVAYQVLRTIAKATPSVKDDEFVEKVAAILMEFGVVPSGEEQPK